jgi:hypothetical protein
MILHALAFYGPIGHVDQRARRAVWRQEVQPVAAPVHRTSLLVSLEERHEERPVPEFPESAVAGNSSRIAPRAQSSHMGGSLRQHDVQEPIHSIDDLAL